MADCKNCQQFKVNMYKRELRKLKTLEADHFMTELINDLHHEDFGIDGNEAWKLHTAEWQRRTDPNPWEPSSTPPAIPSSGSAALYENESSLTAA